MSKPPATDAQLQSLLNLLADTSDCENDCERMLDLAAAWVEAVTEGGSRPLPDSLGFVAEHLRVCPKCLVEVNALLDLHRAEEGRRPDAASPPDASPRSA